MPRSKFKTFLIIVLILGIFSLIVGAGALWWGYNYITRDLPKLTSIEDYKPPATTQVYSSEGVLIAEFFVERRYPAKMEEIPLFVRNAFLAAEDASFYSHQGIDFISILRASYKNFASRQAKQGASTITQQVVKNLLLTHEKSIKRKFKEAILSYQLEKRFSKDGILEIYLNQIFFGNSAYGIKSAARVYFHKELSELTLAEAAILAGLPQAPSKYSPNKNYKKAKDRQKYVLRQMVRAGFITQQAADVADAEDIKVYSAQNDTYLKAKYYGTEVRRALISKLGNEDEIDTGGYQVYTALDLNAYKIANQALRRGLKEVDKRRGWRGVLGSIPVSERADFITKLKSENTEQLEPKRIYRVLVENINRQTGVAKVNLGYASANLNLKEATWARKKLEKDDRTFQIDLVDQIRSGDIIEVSLKENSDPKSESQKLPSLQLDQTPDIEGAIVLLDPHSGKVVSAIGGYSYERSVFNRATQGLRQPGSSFKPIVYLAAIDGFNYTPSTIVYDEPRTFRAGDEFWTPKNYDRKFLGPITLQTALEKSKNLVSADIISRIGISAAVNYAKKMGITSHLGNNLSLSLGSSEVTLLELTRAYGVLASKGVLFDSIFITKIVDRFGKVVYDYENEKLSVAKQVIDPNSAFVMTHMMKGVVERGTATAIKPIGRPVAGKTGTSNEQMDTWFIGFTPDWVAGVWVGFDVKKKIGEKETGGKAAAPIWLYTMQEYLDYRDKVKYQEQVIEAKAEAEHLGIEYVAPEPIQPLDFSIPDGVDPYWVDHDSGALSTQGASGAILEYFKKGTEPGKHVEIRQESEDYLDSADL